MLSVNLMHEHDLNRMAKMERAWDELLALIIGDIR